MSWQELTDRWIECGGTIIGISGKQYYDEYIGDNNTLAMFRLICDTTLIIITKIK